MKVIKDFVTWGVIALPLKRNPISRFMKGGGVQENDERCNDRVARRVSRQLKRGELLGCPCHISIHAWVT
jgi:hypothetical protein